jgi:hypothetical protein
MLKRIFLVILALALVTMACGCNIDLPKAPTPGPDVTDQISVNTPDTKSASLTLTFAAGTLDLASGAENKLVTGTATYNVPDFKPVIKETGADITIKQGDYHADSFPNMQDTKNEWKFKLGSAPMDLTIKAGAYHASFDFGGVSLTSLSINDGAADVKVNFSSPNKEKMSLLTYKTGASNVTLENLANANVSTVVFESGMGNYTLDFGGTLLRDASVTLRSGMSNLTLVIPDTVAATVKVNGGLSNVQFPSKWTQRGDSYTQAGSGPTLTIVVDMGAGNLQITK